MLLVTGATGHLGSATLDFLLKKLPATELGALVRDEAKATDLRAKGIAVRVGNYHQPDSLAQAFAGVDKLLLISTSDMQDRFQQQRNVIDAAKAAGVRHIFYTGSDITDRPGAPIAPIMEPHRATGQYLKDSGLTYTLLHDNLYTDVLPDFMGQQAVETGVFYPAGQGRVPFATRRDMAEAIAHVLTSAGHEGKTYPLAGPQSHSFADVAAALSELAGKPVAYTDVPPAQFGEQLGQAGVPAPFVGFILAFADAITNGDFDRPSSVLAELLGREPTPLKDYLREAYFPA
ncbi:MAG: SDR family oxidoreductase [Janthinobacterium lividum]